MTDAAFTHRARQVATTAVVSVLILLALLWALERLRALLVLVLFSLFCGFALEPAVNRLARRGWSRGAATLAVYVALALAIAGAGAVLGTILVRQVTDLVASLPEYQSDVAVFLEDRFGLELDSTDVAKNAGSAADVTRSLVGGALGFGATLLGVLFQLLTVLTLTFYFVMDGPRLRRAVCSLLPAARQREVLRAWEIAIDRTAGFVFSRIALAVLSTAVHFVGFSLLGLPFTLTLSLWVGIVSQFIPTVGTYIAGALPVAVALADSPRTALWVLLLITVYQQIENYVVSPPLSAHTMRIHPALGFVAAVAGVALIGPLGALLALPLVATVQAFVGEYLVRHEIVEDRLLADDG